MLERILATIRAKGIPIDQKDGERVGKNVVENVEKSVRKTNQKINQKTNQKILALMREDPGIPIKGLSEKTGLSAEGVKWNIRKLKSEGKIRRVGPDKGGHWEVVK